MPDENQDNINHPGQISNLGAVVLCGGKSVRLGVDKTRLDFKGRTFLEQVVAQVGQVCGPIVVVGHTDLSFHTLSDDVLVARDEAIDKGPLEGIRVGLKRLAEGESSESDSPGCEFALVTSCDVPLLKPNLIRFLFEQLAEKPAIVPIEGERVFGMTAIYRTDLHVEIGKRIQAGQLRVSDLAAAFGAHRIESELLREVDSELDSLTNINSVDDYRRLLARLGLACPPELAKAIGLDVEEG